MAFRLINKAGDNFTFTVKQIFLEQLKNNEMLKDRESRNKLLEWPNFIAQIQ
jgi:hypothetical protein